MKKDEVILFKQWDSDTTLKGLLFVYCLHSSWLLFTYNVCLHFQTGRLCFHTAFQDPNAPDDIPPRQSIEARGICFFPGKVISENYFFKCDELASRTSKDLNLSSFLPRLRQNHDKNQNLDKQINSFHIQITFCYQLNLRM